MSHESAMSTKPSMTAEFKAIDSEQGPKSNARHLKAVVIGGGTGSPMSIRALLGLGVQTNAVVAMADDGGSTGILRFEADVTPPGDIRKCIAAFARNQEDPLTKAFKTRFTVARGHTLGNLLLSALEDASGSFPEAIDICERLLDVRGHSYPSTLDRVSLVGRTIDGQLVEGQAVACHARMPLDHVQLRFRDENPRAYPPAVQAIKEADLIVLGPGSLFTSIIPNLLVPGIIQAIRASKGKVLFVCSLADSQGETRGMSARQHLQALYDHGMEGLVDYVLVHSDHRLSADGRQDAKQALASHATQETLAAMDADFIPSSVYVDYEDAVAMQKTGPMVLARYLRDPERPTWHDPLALREALWEVLQLCRSRQK